MEWATLFDDVSTSLLASSGTVVPIGIAVFVALAGLGIAFKFLRRSGVR